MAISYDALFEIFSWLPAKAIYKFTAIDKSVSKFPKEKDFALKQAQNSLSKDDTCFFIQPKFTQGHSELHPLPGEELSSGVSNDVLRFLSNSTKILSSSNGLILGRVTCQCQSQNSVALFIANPATKSWLPIPKPKVDLHNNLIYVNDLKVGLKCDSDDYMIYCFYEHLYDSTSLYRCMVYLSKEGVWKDRKEKFFVGGRNLKFDMPVHHNGAIHFISDSFPYLDRESAYFRPYIMSYNLSNGKSRMLKIPKEARRGSHDYSCNMGIFDWGKITCSNRSICLVRYRKLVFTVWVLIDYKSCLWRRILKVRIKSMGLTEKNPIVTGFVVLNGDLLVFATEHKVYGYGLIGEKYMRIEEICQHEHESDHVHFISYSNTLRKCGR